MIYGNILQAIGNAPLVRLNLNLKIFLSIFLFPQFFYTNANSQPVQTNSDTLNLTDRGRKIEKSEVKKYCYYYNQIYRCLDKYKGEALYKSLSAWLDLGFYMKWLAFNYLVRNGDYTDEAYFYYDPGINKFSIIPWDYDDLFLSAPHEGNIENKKLLGDKFIFSAEDLLDAKIASDTYLHSVYIIQFSEVLNQLSTGVLKKVFESTYAELYPYYSTNEIISMSEYDAYKYANFERLQNDMFALYNQLRFSRDFFMENLRKK